MRSPVFVGAAAVVAIGAVVLVSWALRWKPSAEGDGASPAASPEAALAFAAWSVPSDAVLLVETESTKGGYMKPRRFQEMRVVTASGDPSVTQGMTFDWDAPDRESTVRAMLEHGFSVKNDDPPLPPPKEALFGEPAKSGSGDVQLVTLKGRDGQTAELRRTRAQPNAAAAWNRRAMGFVSPDGHLIYVVPDGLVIRAN